MPIPTPVPGLVVNFRFLWRHEHLAGREEGRKDRPCAIILAVATEQGVTEAVVAPITHTRPAGRVEGIEIPPAVKSHLGLDGLPSWIIVNDLNVFVWPGYDLRPIPGTNPPRFDYGKIPPKLFNSVVARIRELGALSVMTSRD